MKSRRVSPLERAFLRTLILSLSFMAAWQVTAYAATMVTFGDNTGNDFPGTVEDALISERIGYTDYNYGGRTNFHVGDPTDTARTRRSLIRFKDIASNLPAGAVITSAKMYLYCNDADSTSHYSVSAYRVLLDWGEGNSNGAAEVDAVCWNDAQYTSLPWNTAGCNAASDVTGQDSTADRKATPEDTTLITWTGQYFTWDLTTAVRNWHSGNWKEY